MKISAASIKTLTVIIVFVAGIIQLSAQCILPVKETSDKITYRVSIPVDASVSNEAAFKLAQQWVTDNTNEFTRSNGAKEKLEKVNPKNLKEVNTVFANATPLQSLCPASNRMAAKVITKYVGGNGGSIQLLYLEYFMVVTVKDHRINCEITDFNYSHLNQRSYSLQRILNWGDFSSIEPVGKLETLVANEQSHEEFNKFYSFLDNDVNELCAHFTSFIKTNKALALSAR